MTRKEAINRVLMRLAEIPECEDEIRILTEIRDELPLIHWSDSSIRDTVEQFVLDYGKPPTVTDFKKAGMPPHPVFKQKYKMTLAEWLEKNYPAPKRNPNELKEKYTEDFLADYYRIRPRSQEAFNKNRSNGTKGWQTIAGYYGVKSWRKLLKELELPLYFDMKRDHVPAMLKVNVHVDNVFMMTTEAD